MNTPPSPVCQLPLWRQRDGEITPFTVTIHAPQEHKGDWGCLITFGDIFPHKAGPIRHFNSFFAILASYQFIARYLDGRIERGDHFYLDAELKDNIHSFDSFFWPQFSKEQTPN